jgi:hypothetical protein
LLEARLFSPLWRRYQSGFNKRCGYTVVMSVEMPARPCIDQVLKERYLFVLAHLALFVSDELVDQLQNPHLPRESLYRYTTAEVHLSAVVDQLPAIARFPRERISATL